MGISEHISFLCPHCEKVLRVKAELVGRSIRCPDPACAGVSVVPAVEPEPERPRKKGRKRGRDGGVPGPARRHRGAYRLLSMALLLHLGTTGLFYLSLMLVGVSLFVSLWAGLAMSGSWEIPQGDDEVVVQEKWVIGGPGNDARRFMVVQRKGSKTWEVYTLDARGRPVERRVIPAGAPLDASDEEGPVAPLRLGGLAWAGLVLALLATLADLGLFAVPDMRARLLLLGGLLTRLVPALLLLTLFNAGQLFLTLVLLALVVFGCLFCWLMFLRRIGDLCDEPGVMTEARELITVGGMAVFMLALLLTCVFLPFRYLSIAVVWGGLSSGVVKMELVESVLMALIFPTGVPFLIRYLNLTSGVRGCLP